MLPARALTHHGRQDLGRGGHRLPGTYGLGQLLDEPVPQEPDGGPHPVGGQFTDEREPQVRAPHPAPQPFGGHIGEATGFADAEVQPGVGVPEGEQDPLRLGDLRVGRRRVGDARGGRWGLLREVGGGRGLFGGWVGCVLLMFFHHR